MQYSHLQVGHALYWLRYATVASCMYLGAADMRVLSVAAQINCRSVIDIQMPKLVWYSMSGYLHKRHCWFQMHVRR